MIVNKYSKSGGSPFDPTQYYTKPEVDAEISGATEGLASEEYVDAAITAGTQDFVTEAEVTAITSPIQTQLDDVERVTATALTELHDSILELSGATSGMATQDYVDAAITAGTQDFVTEAEVTAITSPIQTQLDDVERVTATALTELHNGLLEVSAATPDMSNYYTKDETFEFVFSFNYVDELTLLGFSNSVDRGFDNINENLSNNYYTKTQINNKEQAVAIALTEVHDGLLDLSGATSGMATQAYVTAATANLATESYVDAAVSAATPDMSNYYTKAEVDAEITGATQGYATEAYVTGATSGLASQSYVTSVITTATAHMVESSDDTIQNMVKITQAGYDALVQGGTVDPYTFYVIIN